MNLAKILFALAALLVAPASCGVPFVESAAETVADAAQDTGSAVTGAASGLDDAINDRPIGLRRRKCRETGGLWAEKVEVRPCVGGRAEIVVDGAVETQLCDGGEGDSFEWMCTFQDASGRTFFADGPSIPPSILAISALMGDDIDQVNYTDLFFETGVQHDYCYHHSPRINGVTQQICDARFFADLASVCKAAIRREFSWFSTDICRSYAALLYAALRAGGESSFNVMNTEVDVPAYVPAYQELGLAEQPDDDDLRQRIDTLLAKVSLDG